MKAKEKSKIGNLNRWPVSRTDLLKGLLSELYQAYDDSFIHTDPVSVVHKCTDNRDREIMAVVMSALAFGQAAQIIRAGQSALSLMNHQPYRFILSFQPLVELPRWRMFYYRMVRASDLLRLLYALQRVLLSHRSLRDWFVSHHQSEDAYLIDTWSRCAAELRRFDRQYWPWDRGKGFPHLLPDPAKGGACKRPNLMLRWLVRKDRVDLGLWNDLPSSSLLIPLDTHIHRIARMLGMTTIRSPSLNAAKSITRWLRQVDPDDPVKYDFALSRLGIVKDCPKKVNPEKCRRCLLRRACGFRKSLKK